MPTVLRKDGYRFFFYSSDWNEPPHVHVEKGSGRGKYWIDPVREDFMKKFTKQEERKARDIVIENQEHLKEKWHDYFS